MKTRLTFYTKLLLDFMFYAGTVVCLTLPVSLKILSRFYGNFDNYYVELCILFFLSGVFAILILSELRKIFQSVLKEDCFVTQNVISLSRMGTYSFVIVALTCCRLFLYITPAVFVIVIVFLIAGLFSKVLAQVFEKAVTYKLENDMTI